MTEWPAPIAWAVADPARDPSSWRLSRWRFFMSPLRSTSCGAPPVCQVLGRHAVTQRISCPPEFSSDGRSDVAVGVSWSRANESVPLWKAPHRLPTTIKRSDFLLGSWMATFWKIRWSDYIMQSIQDLTTLPCHLVSQVLQYRHHALRLGKKFPARFSKPAVSTVAVISSSCPLILSFPRSMRRSPATINSVPHGFSAIAASTSLIVVPPPGTR